MRSILCIVALVNFYFTCLLNQFYFKLVLMCFIIKLSLIHLAQYFLFKLALHEWHCVLLHILHQFLIVLPNFCRLNLFTHCKSKCKALNSLQYSASKVRSNFCQQSKIALFCFNFCKSLQKIPKSPCYKMLQQHLLDLSLFIHA